MYRTHTYVQAADETRHSSILTHTKIQAELDMLYRLAEPVRSEWQSILVMPHHEFTDLARNRLQTVAKHKHLVLYDAQMATHRFDVSSLQSVFSDAPLPLIGTWPEVLKA